MSLDNTGRLYLERQVTLARVVIAALSLVALLETSGAPVQRAPIVFLSAYLAAGAGRGAGGAVLQRGAISNSSGRGFCGAGGLRLSDAFGVGLLVSLSIHRVCAGHARKYARDAGAGRRGHGGDHSPRGGRAGRSAGKASGTGSPSGWELWSPGCAWDFLARGSASIWRGRSSWKKSPACCNSTTGWRSRFARCLANWR